MRINCSLNTEVQIPAHVNIGICILEALEKIGKNVRFLDTDLKRKTRVKEK